MSAAGSKIVAICYHNGCDNAERAWDKMKAEYRNVHMYKVNTLKADDIKAKYADGASKPYFKFYKNGDLQDEVKYESSWSSHEPKVRQALNRHNGGGGTVEMHYNVDDGRVHELKNLGEFNGAVTAAGSKILAVCYHNGCRTAEDAWDRMKKEYRNVFMYKVNTLKADDIKNLYADGSSKPYFKFYKNGAFQDEVKYKSDWSEHEPRVREAMSRHNGTASSSGYNATSGYVVELKNLDEFDKAIDEASSKILCVMFHNGNPEAEKSYDKMKGSYPNAHMYKVNTLNSYDIRDKYADGGSKPFFKFYKKGSLIDEVKYKSKWAGNDGNEPNVKAALARANDGSMAT